MALTEVEFSRYPALEFVESDMKRLADAVLKLASELGH
ncbi:hypothetical protein PAE1116 [Pyrobaculum aerophilum str. IM2]|jgi:hypothetical protein|uniref:Uncharacterized protein n=1 Tax=Pyrobaculum aerophilum (strain ATCC 51768 / DSM 7523 / JCM 9630 / CIP 104966 / NBRC 100827 / IM2) TaxID=178306 RepID=Q8ZXS9_PYRAE|nr:hypothetical protein PAE1116 [Pyrobaculum aerophilum str. IM2]